MAEEIYHVRIRGPFVANSRTRAGVEVSVDDGYTGPLTKDQLAAIKGDPVLAVTKGAPKDGDSKAEGEKIVSEARAEAEKIIADAKAEGEKIVEAAKEAAKKVTESSKQGGDQK